MNSDKPLALISVADKTGLQDFARGLVEQGFAILSTGGSARGLQTAGIDVTDVSSYTGFPEIMAGRVKTLQPKVHGGILARRGTDDAVMAEHGIRPIDIVAVNLYPFEATVSDPDCDFDEGIENIDIGGPAMVRAAAKNHAHVAVIVDPDDYPRILEKMANGKLDLATRRQLAIKAFAHTARYDGLICAWLEEQDETGALPLYHGPRYQRQQTMRYGENPHQRAAFYSEQPVREGTIAAAGQIQGKALSFNNIADADAALETIGLFEQNPACVIVKHANPCGVAEADDLLSAYEQAFATDPTSSFGGIIAFNRELDARTASAIIERQFVEVIVAPAVDAEATEVLARKKNVRLLVCPPADKPAPAPMAVKQVSGGLLVQDADSHRLDRAGCKVVSQRQPDANQWRDLLFAWKVAQMVKSNAIVYATDGRTLGIGAGQMSRVDSARIARWKAADAGLSLTGAVMASDAFFPFRDGIDTAAEAGIRAIIQPGGSIRDEEVIAAADEHGIAMVFTGVRHFRH